MLYPTQIPGMNSLVLVNQIIAPGLYASGNPVFSMLAFGKLPENPVVTPSTTTQVVRPSNVNRYLQTVTVKPIPTTPGA